MAKERILVVDDEEDILELVRYNLSKEGYKITCVRSGELALNAVKIEQPDLILLDLMLPGVDGLDVCKVIKSNQKTKNIAVIMLTAKGEEADIVAGLELGADDYIIKPFSPRILIARVKTIFRRHRLSPEDEQTLLNIEDLVVNPGRHEVTISGTRLDLTYTEFKLLHFLARNPGWVFTRYQIVDAVKGEDYPVTDRSVDVQVVGLRRKLGEYGKYIETVRGVGYKFRDY